jgi:hypothetical protein
VSAWLAMWAYRIQESAAPRKPKWLHMLVCPFCRAMTKYCRQQARARAAS